MMSPLRRAVFELMVVNNDGYVVKGFRSCMACTFQSKDSFPGWDDARRADESIATLHITCTKTAFYAAAHE